MEAIVLTAFLFTVATLMSYMVICSDYPKGYDDHPTWLAILKIWGGLFTVILAFLSWAVFFSWIIYG